VEALSRYVGATPTEELRTQLGWGAPELARLLPELGTRLPEVAGGGAVDAEIERHRLFVAIASLVSALAAGAPAVLVIDDCQWAGPGAVMLLRHLVRALSDVGLLVVVAYRGEEVASNPALSAALADLGRDEGVGRLHLDGMNEAAVAELVDHALGTESEPSARELAARRGPTPEATPSS
jgi:predicted ATPase